MRRFAVILVSTLFPFSLLSLATQSALAAEPDADAPAADAPATDAPPPPPALVPLEPARDEFRQFAILANPLALSIGRYSVQVEYLPALHHAIVLNPVYTHAPFKPTINGQEVDAGSLNGIGGELGYKFYTGNKGPNGFFVGPSFLFASYSSSLSGTADKSFTSVGAALDVGGQAVLGGFTIGGGFGLQVTKTSEDFNTEDFNFAASVIAGGGWRPRALFTIGYAF